MQLQLFAAGHLRWFDGYRCVMIFKGTLSNYGITGLSLSVQGTHIRQRNIQLKLIVYEGRVDDSHADMSMSYVEQERTSSIFQGHPSLCRYFNTSK